MSDDVMSVVAKLETKLGTIKEEEHRTKRMINDLLGMAGHSPRYGDAELEAGTSVAAIRSDQFHGQPMATAVRAYLEMRRGSNLGPAKVAEIYDSLVGGGYIFDTKNAANAKRGLRISLTKNKVFYRLPDGAYGLRDWYPKAKDDKQAVSQPAVVEDQAESADAGEDETVGADE